MGAKSTSGRKNSFVLAVVPDEEELSKVRKFIEQSLQKEKSLTESPPQPLDKSQLENLQLCVSEALTNAIRAHQQRKSSKRIVIKLDLFDEYVVVEVKDKGKGFNPAEIAPSPFARKNLEEAGMGLHLIGEYSNDHEIKSSSKGTSIRMSIFR